MTYEDRERYRDLTDRLVALGERLQEDDPATPVTREEAREIVALLEVVAERLSPERWDHLMETVVHEVSRRAGALAPSR
jgi:hypothetical protein